MQEGDASQSQSKAFTDGAFFAEVPAQPRARAPSIRSQHQPLAEVESPSLPPPPAPHLVPHTVVLDPESVAIQPPNVGAIVALERPPVPHHNVVRRSPPGHPQRVAVGYGPAPELHPREIAYVPVRQFVETAVREPAPQYAVQYASPQESYDRTQTNVPEPPQLQHLVPPPATHVQRSTPYVVYYPASTPQQQPPEVVGMMLGTTIRPPETHEVLGYEPVRDTAHPQARVFVAVQPRGYRTTPSSAEYRSEPPAHHPYYVDGGSNESRSVQPHSLPVFNSAQEFPIRQDQGGSRRQFVEAGMPIEAHSRYPNAMHYAPRQERPDPPSGDRMQRVQYVVAPADGRTYGIVSSDKRVWDSQAVHSPRQQGEERPIVIQHAYNAGSYIQYGAPRAGPSGQAGLREQHIASRQYQMSPLQGPIRPPATIPVAQLAQDGSKPYLPTDPYVNRVPQYQPYIAAGPMQTQVPPVQTTKKRRLHWTPELHAKFEAAVEKFGIDEAVPKTLLQEMNESSLTRDNVASHLQKYRETHRKRKLESVGWGGT